jgi:uncharacterized membrane protein YgcG
MKTLTLLLSLVILASCSATYKTGQTPDDLYYSKAKPVKYQEKVQYDRTVNTYQESNIRMGINNSRWRNLDSDYDYDYRYNPYAYGYNYGYYYNPNYCSFPVYTVASTTSANPKVGTVRKSNLGGYSNTVTNYQPTKVGGTTTVVRRVYNNTNNRNTPTETWESRTRNSGNETRNYEPTNTYTPTNTNSGSGNSGGSSGGSSGGGTPVVRPSRGGGE